MARRMRLNANRAWLTLAACGIASVLAHGQSREWTTAGFDAQRTRWVRSDSALTKAAVESGEFRFLWKAVFDNQARQLESLTEPVLQDLLIGYRGFKALAFVGGTADRIFSIDTDLAKPYWTTHLTYAVSTGSVPASTWECPGGLLAAPSRRTPLAPSTFGRSGGRRGGRATSAVGEPGRGAAVLKEMAAARQKTPPSDPPPASASDPGRKLAPIPFGGVDPLYAMGSDGLLRTLRVSDGATIAPPVPFLPPNAQPSSLTFVDGFVYATTSRGCGAAPNALWVLDTLAADGHVMRWVAEEADIVGTSGPTVGTDGTLYVALVPDVSTAREGVRPMPPVPPNALVALDRNTLVVKDWFAPADGMFNSAPVVFRRGERDMVAITGGDGRLYVLDSGALGGADHRTPVHVTLPDASRVQRPVAGRWPRSPGLATWQDGGTQWILAPETDAVAAFRVSGDGVAPVVERAWQSPPLVSPLAPIVVNGVVFAASSGAFGGGDAAMTAKERADRSRPAVLYALDAVTGKGLWTSGTTIASFARAGLAAGGGRVYVVTFDNTLYAFGIPMEH